MKRRGGPARKPGDRRKNGKLSEAGRRARQAELAGNDPLLRQRAKVVGSDLRKDPRAGYPLGALCLKGLLGDDGSDGRDNLLRHDAGLIYRYLHDRLWGARAVGSNIGNLAAARAAFGADPSILRQLEHLSTKAVADLQRRYQARLSMISGPGNVLAQNIVDRIVLSEEWSLAPHEVPILRRTLASFAAVRE
jgi:hypothetical protein